MNLFRLLALQAVIFGKHTTSTAIQSQHNQSGEYAESQQDQSEELAQHLIKSAVQGTEFFSKGIEILNKLQSSPSCSRKALHGLISECESLHRSSNTETALEEIKEQYAARLAICEVSAAGVAPPAECQVFISLEERSCSSPPCFERLHQSQVKSCLGALHKENQLWTSFSNSLQNVVHVCQASRAWVEKDELIDILRQGVRVQENLTSEIEAYWVQAHAFARSVRSLQLQMQNEIEEEIGKTRAKFAEMTAAVGSSFNELIQAVNLGNDMVEQKTALVTQRLENVIKMLGNFTPMIAELSVDASQIGALINRNLQAWTDADEKAVDLWLHMEAMFDVVRRNEQHLNAFANLINNATDLMNESSMAQERGLTRYNQGLDAIDQRVATILSSMNSSRWSQAFFTMFIVTACTLVSAVKSWKLRVAILVPLVLGYHLVEFVLMSGWTPNLSTALMVLPIILHTPWLIGIAIGTTVLGFASLVGMALYRYAVVQLDGGILPRIEMP